AAVTSGFRRQRPRRRGREAPAERRARGTLPSSSLAWSVTRQRRGTAAAYLPWTGYVTDVSSVTLIRVGG
ncbi:MAG: hypothetical protein M3R63_14710, partial [Actinomycetota bacterium]|nr:hypothetical protein [Actinomycetota bacterium]